MMWENFYYRNSSFIIEMHCDLSYQFDVNVLACFGAQSLLQMSIKSAYQKQELINVLLTE